jgi:hypothetical protein
MAFTGTATIQQISDRIVRLTGLSLSGGGAQGTISLANATGSAADVKLPASFLTEHYVYPPGGASVPFQACIMVDVNNVLTTAGDFGVISFVKSGTTTQDFRITLRNSSASASAGLEIYVKFHE